MEELIRISLLNDYIFCPASIYFHNLYGSMDTSLYHDTPQIMGRAAHKSVDNATASTKKNIITGIDVCSLEYGITGKIDYYDYESKVLIERKKKVKTIYDGYIYQLYGQFFSMIEMGYDVKQLFIYSMDDNRKYSIPLPWDNMEMFDKFKELICEIRSFNLNDFRQSNHEKCQNCIYEPACDRSLI